MTSEKLLKYSTPFGHVWTALTFLCRLLPATTIGDAVYGDEMSDFDCVTTQPGCAQMCYNEYAPMSHSRFWGMLILFLAFPPLIFSFIVANHTTSYERIKEKVEHHKKDASDYINSEHYVSDQIALSKYKMKKRKDPVGENPLADVVWSPSLRRWYVFHLLAKLLMEIVGIVCLYFLQQRQTKETRFLHVWTVPQRYLCTFGDEHDNWACSQDKTVPCWVSRPWEKKIFLLYMLVMSVISILVCVCDLTYTLSKISTKKLRRRREKKILTQNGGSVTPLLPIHTKEV